MVSARSGSDCCASICCVLRWAQILLGAWDHCPQFDWDWSRSWSRVVSCVPWGGARATGTRASLAWDSGWSLCFGRLWRNCKLESADWWVFCGFKFNLVQWFVQQGRCWLKRKEVAGFCKQQRSWSFSFSFLPLRLSSEERWRSYIFVFVFSPRSLGV